MKSKFTAVIIYVTVFSVLIAMGLSIGKAATAFTEQAPLKERKCVIIDAGHGGIDGGATSCSGVLESHINLQFALILNDLMRFLGIETKMIRTDDRSIHTTGRSIAAIKVSDMRERLNIILNTPNGIFVSIHQNYFADSRYSGAQVFYAGIAGSRELAEQLQKNLVKVLNPSSNRNIKKGKGIFLLERAEIPAVLIECGFLSNYEEEAKLRDTEYQRKFCALIGSTIAQYLANT